MYNATKAFISDQCNSLDIYIHQRMLIFFFTVELYSTILMMLIIKTCFLCSKSAYDHVTLKTENTALITEINTYSHINSCFR